MKEKILELLKSDNRPFSIYELNDALGLISAEQLKDLLRDLNDLEDNLQVYRTKRDSYLLFNNSNLRIGTLLAHKKGFGFVDIQGDEDVFIAPVNMNSAIHGDKVIVEIISKKGIELEGKIVRIVKRELKQMVGEFYYKNNIGYINLDDDKVKLFIQIDKDKTMGAMPGHKVLVKVTEKLQNNNYKGEIIRILGHKNDPGVDILSIVGKYGIEDVFNDNVMIEANALPEAITEHDLKGRKDLRTKVIFTIDGDDTKDIDDAISIETLSNGHYLLGVHIADVSYYVKAGSAIDETAYNRGTSVYLADRVIPMLPHKLSNGICSLNPLVDRLTITCDMEIDEKGNIVDYEIYESVINSCMQMTYTCVNKILEEGIIPSGYEKYADDIKKMADLAHILRDNKVKRGYIEFGAQEAKIIVDKTGKAIDVQMRYRGIGENLIEDFMIAANETIASHVYFMELPFIYRVHGEPSEEKINDFMKFLHILGYSIDTRIKNITPLKMQDILHTLSSKKEFHLLSNLLLRSMQKAIYDPKNIGHFGLASKCYTHFTSPIRRYPDTTVHRLLRTYLFDKEIDKDTVSYWENKLPLLTEHASFKEKTSVDCEREVDDMKMAEYMTDHIGEEYTGMVSSVLSFGMFVELDNLVEGLVRIDSLKTGHYYFSEDLFCIQSDTDKRGYRLGDTVSVKVIGANKDARTIDFELVKDVNNGNKQSKSTI